MTLWLATLTVAAGSYVLRVAPLLGTRRPLSPRASGHLADGATAALTALVVSSLVSSTSAGGPEAVATLAAVALGLLVTLRGASMLRVVLIGLAVERLLAVGLDALV